MCEACHLEEQQDNARLQLIQARISALESMLRNANAEATACRERMRTLQVQKQEEQRKETRYGRCLTECQMAYSKALQALQERKELNSTLQACLAT